MANLVSNEIGVTYDGLIGGLYHPLVTKNVTLKSTTFDFKRGMVLADDGSGKFELAGNSTSGKKLYVLAEDVSVKSAEGVATVYTDGVFNREALKFKDSAPADLEDQIAGVLTKEAK